MLGKTGLFDASPDVLSIVANAPHGIFGQIVVPRDAVMLQKRKKALAISEQALLQGFGCFGFVDPLCERIEKGIHAFGVPLQMTVLETVLIDRGYDRSQKSSERSRDRLKLLIKWIIENCAVHIAHEVDKASLMQTREPVVRGIEIRNQHPSKVLEHLPQKVPFT
jgi:hypothetical protein